jgi:hypothetical protein
MPRSLPRSRASWLIRPWGEPCSATALPGASDALPWRVQRLRAASRQSETCGRGEPVKERIP